MLHGNAASRAPDADGKRRRIAVIGSGIAGLSCAWALGSRHQVVLYEKAARLGGHSNTVTVPELGGVPIDAGFIVFNEPAYPNLTALFAHVGVETAPSDMSFAVSADGGAFEYGASGLNGLFAQRRNLLRPRFWRMLRDILRFYRTVPADLSTIRDEVTLGEWLDAHGPWRSMRADHLRPMAAAIWSSPGGDVEAYSARAFLRFCTNHGLVQLTGRPLWRTVRGGSARYVEKLAHAFTGDIRVMAAVDHIGTMADGIAVASGGGSTVFDAVVLACHAPDARAMLGPSFGPQHRALAPFRVTENRIYLHADSAFMPRRRAAWASWNASCESGEDGSAPCVTYWMNRLQPLPAGTPDVFVTLNPPRPPNAAWHEEVTTHPAYDAAALAGQRDLWSLQGQDGVWFAGAWLGAGFHEDGLQSGLAVAEALEGARRPWRVEQENARMPGDLPRRAVTERAA